VVTVFFFLLLRPLDDAGPGSPLSPMQPAAGPSMPRSQFSPKALVTLVTLVTFMFSSSFLHIWVVTALVTGGHRWSLFFFSCC
jgi:hypothetical protein